MANICGRGARQALIQSTTSRNAVVSKLFGTSKSPSSPCSKAPCFGASNKPVNAQFSPQRLFSSSRLPVELGCVQSMLPLHSATASALLTNLLSLHAQSWGILSEGTILDDS